MKRFLPIFVFSLLILLFAFPFQAFAVDPTPTTPPAATAAPTPTSAPGGAGAGTGDSPIPGCDASVSSGSPWVCDAEVTFIGKAASRAKDFLDWTLNNYAWINVSNNDNSAITSFWKGIQNILNYFLVVVIIATAIILMVTRGKSITLMKFIPRFIFVIIFCVLSFSVVQLIYQASDVIQGFFLHGPGLRLEPGAKVISGNNLFHISWDYEDFVGYRSTNGANQEAAYTEMLMLKLTIITFYVMAGLLLVRKIILWLFIAVSPVFPFLFLYYPIRNTGKIWIGEFFRWLLYGPLFALFLFGLVALWQFGVDPTAHPNKTGIPLGFDTDSAGHKAGVDVKYPTAINIVIGGPGQVIGKDNNVNLPDTYVLYVFALLMVWTVTIFPFVLLRIFLDQAHAVMAGNNWFTRQLGRTPFAPQPGPAPRSPVPSAPIIPKTPLVPPPPPPPPSSRPGGMARAIPTASQNTTTVLKPNLQQMQDTQRILQTTKLSVPTIRDVARFETASLSNSIESRTQATHVSQTLQKIANPTTIADSAERSQYTMIRQQLSQESQKGNLLATSILNAAKHVTTTETKTINIEQNIKESMQKIVNPAVAVTPSERQEFTNIRQQVVQASQQGDPVAKAVLSSTATKEQLETAKQQGNPVATKVLNQATKAAQAAAPALPAINRVQAVSLDDYESVKKMWKENYQKLEPPQGKDRTTWISQDQQKISETINLLSSTDKEKEKKGMEMVGNILPFLLIGGFSKSEVVAYLKAKLEAGKGVLEDIRIKQEEEETKVAAGETKKEEQKTMTMEEAEEQPKEGQKELPEENTPQNGTNGNGQPH